MHTGKDIIYQDEMKKNRKENSIENNKYQRPARSNWYFGDSGRKNPSLTNSLSTPEAQMMWRKQIVWLSSLSRNSGRIFSRKRNACRIGVAGKSMITGVLSRPKYKVWSTLRRIRRVKFITDRQILRQIPGAFGLDQNLARSQWGLSSQSFRKTSEQFHLGIPAKLVQSDRFAGAIGQIWSYSLKEKLARNVNSE